MSELSDDKPFVVTSLSSKTQIDSTEMQPLCGNRQMIHNGKVKTKLTEKNQISKVSFNLLPCCN